MSVIGRTSKTMIKSKIIILFMLIASGIYFWSNDKNESYSTPKVKTKLLKI